MNNIVILDVETTGIDHLLDEICQMSYVVVDQHFNVVKAKNYFFMVDYVQFKSNKKKLNIDELKILSNNKTFKDQYEEIFNDLNNNLIVCHKCEHDLSFLKSEFMRVDNKKEFVYEEFCTMKYYTNILKIPSESFGYKYPKLVEIMPYLNIKRGEINNKVKEIFNLNDNEIEFHDSRVDVVATYLVAAKTDQLVNEHKKFMKNQQIIKIQKQAKANVKVEINDNVKKENLHFDIKSNDDSFKYSSKHNIEKQKMSMAKCLFSLNGDINNKVYRSHLLLTIGMYLIGVVLIRNVYMNTSMSDDSLIILLGGLSIIKGYVLISLSVKRLRNMKKSPWLALLLLIGVINFIFILTLCFSKDVNDSNENLDISKASKKNKVNKLKKLKIVNSTTIIIGSLLMPILVLIVLGGGLSILVGFEDTEVDPKIDQAIELVKYTQHNEGETTINTYLTQKVEEIDPYYIDGWYGYEIGYNTYLVCFDFDMYDDDYENGYSSYPYEVNIDTEEIIEISSDELIKEYEELGYFDDEVYINQFKLEKSM